MHFAFACFLVVAMAAKNANGQAGKLPPPPYPPFNEFKGSTACQTSIEKCFKQLAKSLEPGEPYKVPNCDPCKECLARKLSTLKAYGSCASIIGKIPNEKNVKEETMFYNDTIGFDILDIECKTCVAKFAGAEYRGSMKMVWKEPRLFVVVKKEPWYSAKAEILRTDVVGGQPDPSTVDITCTGDDGWIQACQSGHKSGVFIGICLGTATAMFPAASNERFEKTEGDGDNSLGKLLGCNTPVHVEDSPEDCLTEKQMNEKKG